MIQLLKIEWMKLRGYRTFWILGILYLLSVIAASYIGFTIEQRTIAQEQMLKAIAGTSFGYPDLWQSVSYMSSFLIFLPALLIITFVTNEFNFKTHRQNIIDGWSREQFVTVKIVLVLLLTLLSTIMVFITVLIIGALGDSSFSWENCRFLWYFFIQSFSYCSLALLTAILIKRSGLALGIFLLYAYLFENVLAELVNWRIKSHPGNFLPLNTTDRLIPFPFIKNVTKHYYDSPNPYLLLGVAALYLAVYFYITISRMKKADL